LKKHGRVLYTKRYIDEISIVDKDLASIITLLHSVNKTTNKNIVNFIHIIKNTQDSYRPEFIIDAPLEYKEIKEYLKKKFKDSEISSDIVDNI
jgi:hypothetical protein